MIQIICEGRDDKNFINQFIRHLKLNACSVEQVGGKGSLLAVKTYSGITKEVQAGRTKKVLFVFDADFIEDDRQCGGLKNSQQCIQDLIQNLGWNNIAVDYYIFDKNLDDFIIKTLDNKTDFEACEQCFKLKKLNKNRKILTCIYQKLYPVKPYDFSHTNFNQLQQKLINLFNKS
ncbi:hypothetical protein MNB_SUP05-SYMBIONT-5-311 [hydrothermal vent metagenome]|uniref:DUF4435 domain-containing protein n=1 Tax=hydrothermal vent metagenome TaxID=652676 RepID=A0A1W1E3U1_9ZZZZ